MTLLTQITALTAASLRGISARRVSSLVTVIGVASVVGVLVSLLAMREGANELGGGNVNRDRAVVLARGASGPFQSSMPREAALAVADAPGVKRAADGVPYVDAMAVVSIGAIRHDGRRGNILLVGSTADIDRMQPDLRIVEGRSYQPAVHELVIAAPLTRIFRGMRVGDRVPIRGSDWTIVGAFAGDDSIGGSVLRADAETVLSAFGRNTFQQIDVQLESPAAYPKFQKALMDNPAVAVDVRTLQESRDVAIGSLLRLLNYVAYIIAGVMAAGAICGALNSLYASVESRRGEIATLRAIGFDNVAVVLSLLIEGMVLALPGALIGAAIAWLMFSGRVVSTSGVVFTLTITSRVLLVSVAWALAIGLLGATWPALRAARIPVATGLRAT